jgi:hypothetical protein
VYDSIGFVTLNGNSTFIPAYWVQALNVLGVEQPRLAAEQELQL